MKLDGIPYIHFMVEVGHGKNRGLIAACEACDSNDAPSQGGCFAVPIKKDDQFFPVYRFDFSIYKGNGTFVEVDGKRSTWTGLAISVALEKGAPEHIVLASLASIPGEDLTNVPRSLLQSFLKVNGEGLDWPVFRKMPRRLPLPYIGQLDHPDFNGRLRELQLIDPRSLDKFLDTFGIALIGCEHEGTLVKLEMVDA